MRRQEAAPALQAFSNLRRTGLRGLPNATLPFEALPVACPESNIAVGQCHDQTSNILTC